MRVSHLPARALLAVVLCVLAALVPGISSPALAAGTCSVWVPRHLTVDSPHERFVAHLQGDCRDSGENWASWDIRHYAYGLTDQAEFASDTGNTQSVWEFDDWEDLGTYFIEPWGAYDARYFWLSQNTLTRPVRFGSRLSLTASRSGNQLTLRSHVSRYRPWASGFRSWVGKSVAFSYKTCPSCAWHHIKTPATDEHGDASVRVHAAHARDYRAIISTISTTWGRTSGAVHR